MLDAGTDFEFFNPYAKVKIGRANLPHWRQKSVLYFTTFRLADSIPQEKTNLWRENYSQWLLRNPKPWNESQIEEFQIHFARKIEYWLDKNHGTCILKNSKCKRIVEDCLRKFNGLRYQLDALVVATNHVHVLVAPHEGNTLSAILKSWKGVSARKINQELSREGTLWQKETFDHIVRNESSLLRIRQYIQAHK
jgi:REP element-mobilizing transposase RayT